MILYIAGPMTGHPDLNFPAFFEAEARLFAAGFTVLNPALNQVEGTQSWLAYMRLSLHQIADCDGIATLPGWQNSKGASIEVGLALSLGLPVKTVSEWVSAA
jgi:nucleoside 2-deoxyribosyltransferase